MERAWDDDDLPDYGPVTQGEHRKAEVAGNLPTMIPTPV